MRIRSHQRKLIMRSSAGPRSGYDARPFTGTAPTGRIRGSIRTGVPLTVGVMRLARAAGARWRPVLLVAGALLMVIGVMLRSSVAFVSGLLVLGPSLPDALPFTPETGMVGTWAWLRKGQAHRP